MAPVASTVALSHLEGVSDSARARELYKYYQPAAPVNADTCFPSHEATSSTPPSFEDEPSRDIRIASNVTSSKISSPDTALTAFCQLVTWRTGAQRAMISVIDAETQYFVAESTKTVDLVDNSKHAPGDDIWMGCSSVSKAGRLCERTISTAPTPDGEYPCFIVDDLSKDERFNTLPFVTGSPFLRFYAGVPLITKKGIPIGSLFVVDDRVGTGLSREKIHFMGTMAATIMKHMEMLREVEQHRRGMKMSRGLASFVEGRAEMSEETDNDNEEGTKIAGQFEPEPTIPRTTSRAAGRQSVASSSSIERREKEYSAALRQTEEAILAHTATPSVEGSERPSLLQPDSFGATSVTSSSHENSDKIAISPGGEQPSEIDTMRILFSRAANLIREAFEVDGGAIFYDAQSGFSSDLGRKTGPVSAPKLVENAIDSPFDSYTSGEELQPEDPTQQISPPSFAPPGESPPGEGMYSRTTGDNGKMVEILGFSTPDGSSVYGDSAAENKAFIPLQEKALHVLLKRYPRGKLWTFDSDGSVSSSSDEEPFMMVLPEDRIHRQKKIHKRKKRNQRNKSDAVFLYKHFPGVRQLLFVPLWDAGRSHWLSGCFAWSTEPTRVLSKQSELAFLSAFGNSVMAEWSRIDTELADQKKGDFIGSISHELRSPLHGILASAEFLAEVLNGWEGHLVETIDSCGRTLLDTINHILDFSKINHFEKNWRRSKRGAGRRASGTGPLALRKSDLPMLNLFQDVDVSVICEEVVESVFAGHVFQNITAQSFDMVPTTRDKMSDFSNNASEMRKASIVSGGDVLTDTKHVNHPGVAVILDVDPQNYHFTTQPGALRRLIMNLLGNSLKYTSHGYVRVKLDAVEMEDLLVPSSEEGNESIPRSRVTLTVTDTGKGISADFLRSKLFMPFAQENLLSNGTGLGLSIVRKIVSLLEGEITIDSELGRGTQVKVILPLLRELPKTAGSSTSTSSKSVTSFPRDMEEYISNLRVRTTSGLRVYLSGFDPQTKDSVTREMYRLLKGSLINFLTKWYGFQVVAANIKAHLIISNEEPPVKISSLVQQSIEKWGTSPSVLVLCSHNSKFERIPSSESKVGYVTKPVGALKLAKAIIQCLDGAPPAMTPGLELPSPNVEKKVLSEGFEELSLSSHGGEVLDNHRMASASENARKAIESPTPNASSEKEPEFPFPITDKPALPKAQSMPGKKGTLEKLTTDQGPASKLLTDLEVHQLRNRAPASPSLSKSLIPPPASPSKNQLKKIPSLLVVDDNQINQRLLSTYLTRKGYETVHQASHGMEAVDMVKGRFGKEGRCYDIIFMDITMPVLDGFGATRMIREIEATHAHSARLVPVVGPGSQVGTGTVVDRLDPTLILNSPSETVSGATLVDEGREREKEMEKERGIKNSPALIIAFTGRSSIEDQNEAVRVGLDLFMTKPVAFKEVGRIIDNWVANVGR